MAKLSILVLLLVSQIIFDANESKCTGQNQAMGPNLIFGSWPPQAPKDKAVETVIPKDTSNHPNMMFGPFPQMKNEDLDENQIDGHYDVPENMTLEQHLEDLRLKDQAYNLTMGLRSSCNPCCYKVKVTLGQPGDKMSWAKKAAQIYNHQPGCVKGKGHYKSEDGKTGIWWCGEAWWIGAETMRGQCAGYTYNTNKATCPDTINGEYFHYGKWTYHNDCADMFYKENNGWTNVSCV